MSTYDEIEDRNHRRKALNRLCWKYENNIISYDAYMQALDGNFDILYEFEEKVVEEWKERKKIEQLKIDKELIIKKRQEKFRNEQLAKKHELDVIYFFIILGAITGIIVLIWTKMRSH